MNRQNYSSLKQSAGLRFADFNVYMPMVSQVMSKASEPGPTKNQYCKGILKANPSNQNRIIKKLAGRANNIATTTILVKSLDNI